MNAPAFDHNLYAGCAAQIISHTRELAAKGFTPATAGNFSIRMGPDHAAITISGKDKGRLTEADIMVVDMDNNPEIASTYGVRSAPTILIFKEGEMVERILGVVPKKRARSKSIIGW